MSSRGYLNFLKDHPAYKNLDKDWHVELTNYNVFWFDLLINTPGGSDYESIVSKSLNVYREEVEQNNDKRFVYFIAARDRVRFHTAIAPRLSRLKNEIVIHLEVGAEKKKKEIRMPARPEIFGMTIPRLLDDGRFILLQFPGMEHPVGLNIHEFLMMHCVNIGVDTEVLYVGSTDDPARRPLKRNHRGYSDSIYGVNTAEKDVFVYYNLFKAISISQGSPHNLQFMLGNSMIDEVQKKDEGMLLEHGLVHYFGAKSQEKSKGLEYGRLRSGLKKLKQKYNISSVSYHIEAETSTEYWNLYSREVPRSGRHEFSLVLQENRVLIGRAKGALNDPLG
ncbi:hypothetical protein SAMN05216600_109163 [Pseudomonas cuatrocienegasensis]|uniref:Uncharacterized protein n=1 Tax=Pseudomonas cuatrocienegasensis TaxID=543360 RepID=A0ABY1BFZ1_9PSED|nr:MULTISPECIES: hypothetical protein [Pseudomonas]SEQ76208.1 hypothetical protein SAMN05216600_109163 [Pseudomonas cuatrocienegasensis]